MTGDNPYDLINKRERLKYEQMYSHSSTLILSTEEKKRREEASVQRRNELLSRAKSLINQDFSSSGKIVFIGSDFIHVCNSNSITVFDHNGKTSKKDCLISIWFSNNTNLSTFAIHDKVIFSGRIAKINTEFFSLHSYPQSPDVIINNNSFQKQKQSDSSCFIATAVYDSPIAPEVMELKKFRDDFLLVNSIGKSFVRFYYWVSPSIAVLIAKSTITKNIVRCILIQPILIGVRHSRKSE